MKLQCWSSAGVGSSLRAANPACLLHAAVNTNTNTKTNTNTDTNTKRKTTLLFILPASAHCQQHEQTFSYWWGKLRAEDARGVGWSTVNSLIHPTTTITTWNTAHWHCCHICHIWVQVGRLRHHGSVAQIMMMSMPDGVPSLLLPNLGPFGSGVWADWYFYHHTHTLPLSSTLHWTD